MSDSQLLSNILSQDFGTNSSSFFGSPMGVNIGTDTGLTSGNMLDFNLGVSDSNSSLINFQSAFGQQGQGNSGFMDFFDSDTFKGISTGLNALSSLGNLYQGMRALSLAKDQYNFNKNAFSTSLANQANITNERLATRQASRYRSAGVPEDQIAGKVAEFMSKYGVSGKLGG